MKFFSSPRSLIIGFGVSTLLFWFWTFLLFHDSFLKDFDQRAYEVVSGFQSPLWIGLNRGISFMGEGKWLVFAAALLGVYFLCRRWWRWALWPLISVSLLIKITFMFKEHFDRVRPVSLDPLTVWHSLAYPSGHCSGSLFFYGLLIWMWGKNKKILAGGVLLVTAISLSRIFLGAHWFSDTVGGFLLGGSWLFLNLLAAKIFFFHESKI